MKKPRPDPFRALNDQVCALWRCDGPSDPLAKSLIKKIERLKRSCSFCGKCRDEMSVLCVATRQLAICIECVDLCREKMRSLCREKMGFRSGGNPAILVDISEGLEEKALWGTIPDAAPALPRRLSASQVENLPITRPDLPKEAVESVRPWSR